MLIHQTIFIDYAHRLQDSEHLITKKCCQLHGHTAKITIEFCQDNNRSDMVIDFSAIKNIVNEYDHKTILSITDSLYQFLYEDNPKQVIGIKLNPTIEVLAKMIWADIYRAYPDLQNLKIGAVEGYKGPDSPIVTYEN